MEPPATAKSTKSRHSSTTNRSSKSSVRTGHTKHTETKWSSHEGSVRPDTASSCRSGSTCMSHDTSLATSIATGGRDFTGAPSSGRRTAGISSEHQLRKKMAMLEHEVEQERKARLKMEKQVQDLRSEVCSEHSGRESSRSRVT